MVSSSILTQFRVLLKSSALLYLYSMKVDLMLSCLVVINLNAFCHAFFWPNIWEVTNLRAVSRFRDIDKFYVSTRARYECETQPQEATKTQKRADVKKKICRSIFNSHHFRMYARAWVDVDHAETFLELESYYENIFKKIFNANNHYENAYSLQRVNARNEGIYNEYLFVCPARNVSTKNIEEFLVSREYDVNVVEDHNNHPIAGRFVFKHNDRGDLVLLAMAEEAAAPLLPWPIRNRVVGDFLNLMERYDEDLFATLTENPAMDPICNLEDAFKLRLCSVMFGAPEFEDKVMFLPTMKNVLTKCQKKTISVIGTRVVTKLLDRYIRPSWGRIFEEWVMGCYAMNKSTNSPIIYYVSRGTWDNTIFTYTDAGNKNLSTYNYFYNVSVADAK